MIELYFEKIRVFCLILLREHNNMPKKNKELVMLVITRRPKESIFIELDGKLVKITLLTIRGNQAQIGVDAPREVPVHREEIYNRIKEGEPLVK
jgi:carbon storage regulator